MAHWQTVPKLMDVSQKTPNRRKVVEMTGVGPKDDYTSNGAMARERTRLSGG